MHRGIGVVAARRRGATYGELDSAKWCKNCVFGFMVVASGVLLLTGAIFISQEAKAAVQRSKLVVPFDRSVAGWGMTYREEFSKGTFMIELDYNGVEDPRSIDGEEIDLKESTVKDFLDPSENYHDDLETYDGLSYRAQLKAEDLSPSQKQAVSDMKTHSSFLVIPQEWLVEPIPHRSPVSTTTGKPLPAEVISEDVDAPISEAYYSLAWVPTTANVSLTLNMWNEDGKQQTFKMMEIPAGLARMTSNNFKSCRPRGGIHQTSKAGPHCTFLLAASRVCLVVNKDKNNLWEVRSENQVPCHQRCTFPCTLRNNGTIQYIPQWAEGPALSAAVGKGKMEIIVRSVDDPYISAWKLTNGTLSFGPSTSGSFRSCYFCLLQANNGIHMQQCT